jgi:exodeoxyribonuclease VII large subunit
MFKWANESLKFALKDGMKVIAKGNIDVYTPQGRYNFIISEVHPKGIGELYLQFLQLKEKLAKEGLFEVRFKKPIPKYPNKVGIITSPTGAAVKDITNIMKRRFPYTKIVIIPTLVQGGDAAEDIVKSIHILNRMEDVDVAIVGRGGGSIEDLWPFNEEIVARTIFESEVPIVSAVGHESDFTIADFVADLRAATPSAAAELVVPDKQEVLEKISSQLTQMTRNIQALLKLKWQRVEGLISILRPRLLMDRVVHYQQRTDDLTSNMIMQIQHRLSIDKKRYQALCEMLDAVSPLATLKRGYSITQKLPEGSTVDSVESVSKGDDVCVILKDGKMKCGIQEIKKTNDIFKPEENENLAPIFKGKEKFSKKDDS